MSNVIAAIQQLANTPLQPQLVVDGRNLTQVVSQYQRQDATIQGLSRSTIYMIIQLLNGTQIDTASYSLKRLFHFIPSAVIDHTTQSVEGRPDIILSSQLNNRVIRIEFLYEAADIYDYYLLRDELNDLFMRTEPFYIIF